ncbi:ATP-binding response regulator [Duganella qianjiadongensis]|uniref:histidine kinase n=1 Tax=Duganella qianjiadongensis TaxID=2692176 RepID=A0ABW9VSD8_9BURK|nr:hybrid sensor histidine kinase/response regulator [Duganella qianjiadongensis]MYM42010.1 response regulator [Duganella qianjiadongensis]
MNISLPTLDEASRSSRVLQDQVRALESASVGARIATIGMGLVGFWTFHKSAQLISLSCWLMAQMLFNLYSLLAGIRLRRIPLSGANVFQRLRRSIALPAMNGLIWAGGIWMMWIPGNFPMQLVLIFFVIGLSSGALNSLKASLPALFLFLIPCVGSVIVTTLAHLDSYSMFVVTGASGYFAWSSTYAVGAHRSLIRSLYNHYQVEEMAVKLQAQKEIAEMATEAKSRFLAAASHDLRQPMHALNLYLGALANLDLPPSAHPVLDKVRECAHTMDEMFSALLNISSLDANAMEANFTTFPIAMVLNKIELEFSPQAQAKGLQLRVAPCSVLIRSDADLFENILRNLVSNAVRYTTEGKILVGCRRTGDTIRCGVYDTGMGIAIDQQAAIFEEFFQIGNKARDRSKGLGLGLAIALRQARLMHTPLTVRSEIGHGSVFEVEIPRSLLPPTPLQKKPLDTLNGADLEGKLIVVIDDESMILSASRLLLEQFGCHVITASSGAEALQMLASSPCAPDAIICDYRLRDNETGIQVVTKLRNEFNLDVPAILITGDTSPQQIKTIASTGISVMHKPLQSQILQTTLISLINQSSTVIEVEHCEMKDFRATTEIDPAINR